MIMMNYLTKIDLGQGIFTYEIFTLIVAIGLINLLQSRIHGWMSKSLVYMSGLIKRTQTTIDIIGWEFLNNGLHTFEYPQNMTAINYYIYSLNKSTNFKYFNNKRNGIYYIDEFKGQSEHDQTPNYILNDVYNIKIDDDIYITVTTDELTMSNEDKKSSINSKITMTLRSYKNDTAYIEKFINKCIIAYDNYTTNKNKNKTYHFIYQGKNNGKLVFSSKIISDFNNPDNQNYETFDTIYHSNKDIIIKDIERLRNIEYYKKTGLKRKKGYLFYGEPGTGKTATVMAMSNFDQRHIIEVPLNRVKTNTELEQILSLNHINNIKFNPNNIIILFDELDIGTKLQRKKKNIKKTKTKFPSDDTLSICNDDAMDSDSDNDMLKNLSDKLNLGTLLSRLDGIGNYAGLIIVATTNDISTIDKALYRDGRLNLMMFDYASHNDIINIIE
jgi:hypothetical protein